MVKNLSQLNGRGSWLGWSEAPFWTFSDGVCALYNKEKFLTEIRKNYTTSYTGVDFFADGRKNKLVESIAFAIIF